MSSLLHRRSAAAVGLLIACLVTAQPAAPSSRADPLDAAAPAPPALHRSALGAYRPARETAVGSWRDANDTVARIGGWKAYLREAQAPEGGASAAPAAVRPADSPDGPKGSGGPGAPGGQGGHHGGHHGGHGGAHGTR